MRAQGRTAAIAGAVVAVGAATMMGLTGIASATPAGSCLENVNVRAEPSMDSRIVAVCEAGTAVDTGETRNGFVRVINLGGWAAEEFVAVDESSASDTTAPAEDAPSDELGSPNASEPVGGSDTTGGDTTGSDTTGSDATGDQVTGDDATGDDTAAPTDDSADDAGGVPAAPTDPTSGLGGLLG